MRMPRQNAEFNAEATQFNVNYLQIVLDLPIFVLYHPKRNYNATSPRTKISPVREILCKLTQGADNMHFSEFFC